MKSAFPGARCAGGGGAIPYTITEVVGFYALPKTELSRPESFSFMRRN